MSIYTYNTVLLWRLYGLVPRQSRYVLVNPVQEVRNAHEGVGGGGAPVASTPRVETDDVPVAVARHVNVCWTTAVALWV